jgi:hypothetical protein
MKQVASSGVLIRIVISLAFLWGAEAFAVAAGHVDDFDDGTTQGWQEGGNSPNPPTNIANGGPLGVGDNYLSNTSTGTGLAGSKQVMYNTSGDWTGNFVAAGITLVRLDVTVSDASEGPLQLRLAFEGSNGAWFNSKEAFEVPNDGLWHSVFLPFVASEMVQVAAGGTFAETAAAVTQVRLMHRPSSPAIQGENFDGVVGYDNISAIAIDYYSGWLWESGSTNSAPLVELEEEICFGPLFLGLESDDNWFLLGEDACVGRRTTNTQPARNFVNYDPNSGTIPFIGSFEVRSTQPMASAGGNLSEIYGEDIENSVGLGGERLATVLEEPSGGDLAIIGGYNAFGDLDNTEYFGFVDLFVKDSPDTRAARSASDLEGRWYQSFFARFVARSAININVSQTGLRVLDLEPGGVCSFSVPDAMPDPAVVNNGDLFTTAQIALGGATDLTNRGVVARVSAFTRSACTYEIDADGYLSIDFTFTDISQEPPVDTPVNLTFVISDDDAYGVRAPDEDGFDYALSVLYRAPTSIGVGGIDGKYLFYLNVTDLNGTGFGHTAGATGRQIFELFGRGLIEFDSTMIVATPQGQSGDWYQCGVDLLQTGGEFQADGEPESLSVTTDMNLDAESAQIDCAYQLASDGSLLVNLTTNETGEEILFGGYVNDNGELLTLVDLFSEIENPESAIGNLSDTGSVRHFIAMKYTGNPDGNEDGDELSNLQEFKAPLPPPPAVPLATPALFDTGEVGGQETWAGVTWDPGIRRFVASVHRASNGAAVAEFGLGADTPIDVTAIDDSDPLEDSALAVLGIDGSGTPKVRKYRQSDGTLLLSTTILQQGWDVLDIVTLDDMNADGLSEYAVLGRNVATGENAAQVRNGSTGAFIKNVFFLNPSWQPIQLVALPDFAGSAAPEIGLLATNDLGQIVVMVKDAGTNAFIRNVFFLNANWTPQGALPIANFGGAVSGEIGLGAFNNGSGQIVVMVKDASSNVFLNNVFPLGSSWELVSGAIVPDETANGASEIASLGVNKSSGKIVIQVRDGSSGVFIRNQSPFGSNWTPGNMLAYGSGGSQVFVVIATRKSDGLPVVQTIEALSGNLVGNVFLN